MPPPQKGVEPPNFRPMSVMARWIKMALGMEVGLSPGHTVLGGDTAPLPQKGAEPPIFCPFLLWQNNCMYQDTT